MPAPIPDCMLLVGGVVAVPPVDETGFAYLGRVVRIVWLTICLAWSMDTGASRHRIRRRVGRVDRPDLLNAGRRSGEPFGRGTVDVSISTGEIRYASRVRGRSVSGCALNVVLEVLHSEIAKMTFAQRRSRFEVWVAILVVASVLTACEGTEPSDSMEMPATVAKTVDTMTVDRVLKTDSRFSTLVSSLDSTGLDSVLAHGGPYTIFAPPNASFDVLPDGTLSVLLSDRREQFRTILAQHIVEGRVSLDTLSVPTTLRTLSGDSIQIRPTDSTLAIGTARVLEEGIPVGNGVIHVVDAVLRPPASASAGE